MTDRGKRGGSGRRAGAAGRGRAGASRPLEVQSRPMLERIYRIVNLIGQRGYPNCRQMARELEFSERTVHRDIDFLRTRMDLPIEYDERRHGYYFSKDVGDFPMLNLQSSDLLALFIAEKILSQYAGTGLERRLRRVFDKIVSTTEGAMSVTWKELDDLLSFKPGPVATQDIKLFETLATAVRQRRELEIAYTKLAARKPERRVIHPHHLVSYNGLWYVIAHDRRRRAMRTFALSRIAGIQKTAITFTPDPDFDPVAYQEHSFGIFHSDGKPRTVRIRFDAPVSRLIRERQWHESQKIKPLDDDAIELTLRIGNLTEVANWILSWGASAEVIEPSVLRKHILSQIEGMAARYR